MKQSYSCCIAVRILRTFKQLKSPKGHLRLLIVVPFVESHKISCLSSVVTIVEIFFRSVGSIRILHGLQ